MNRRIEDELDKILSEDITTDCSYHPAGRNHLFLNPLERQVIIERIKKVLSEQS